MEIAYHKKLEERILAGSVLPLGTSRYFLIEPSFQGEQEGSAGMFTIFTGQRPEAHPCPPGKSRHVSADASVAEKVRRSGAANSSKRRQPAWIFWRKKQRHRGAVCGKAIVSILLPRMPTITAIDALLMQPSGKTSWPCPVEKQLLLFCKGNIDEIFPCR